jgi:hypothetical protein
MGGTGSAAGRPEGSGVGAATALAGADPEAAGASTGATVGFGPHASATDMTPAPTATSEPNA